MCFVSSDFRLFSCSQQYEEKIASLLTPQYILVSVLLGRDFLLLAKRLEQHKELKARFVKDGWESRAIAKGRLNLTEQVFYIFPR